MNYEETASKEQREEKVIDRILKQLTPENIKKQIKEIQEIELPLELQKWVQEYEKVGERNTFMWKWVYKVVQITTLSIVPEKYKYSVWKTKTLLVMFDSLLDDIADRKKSGQLLDELIKIPFRQTEIKDNLFNPQEKEYLELTKKLWRNIENLIKEYPRYEEFKDLLRYDVNQLLNTMEYAYLINKNPYLINKKEHWKYMPPNMSTMICYTIDLMCSSLGVQKLSKLRTIGCEAQKMARIGNSITTWERELKEKDFTSGIISYALRNNLIKIEDLQKEDKENLIKKIKDGKIENYFLQRWNDSFNKIKIYMESSELIDIDKSLEQLLIMHLTSKGYK